MFNIFIGIVLSIAINLFGAGYDIGVDTCADVYYSPDTDCMVSVMVDSDTGEEYTIADFCAGRASRTLVIRCNDCGGVVYAVTFTEFRHNS